MKHNYAMKLIYRQPAFNEIVKQNCYRHFYNVEAQLKALMPESISLKINSAVLITCKEKELI